MELHQLIKDCTIQKRQAQNALYNLLAPKMYVVCLRYAKSREEAEETLQEGFVKVFKNIHLFRFEGSFEGWVRRIMVNCALEKYRNRTNLHAILQVDQMAHEPLANEEVYSNLGTKELLYIVHQLPPVYKMVFNLYVFEGLKHREIAQLLGISEGTSKSNLSDARAILKKTITENAKKELSRASNF